MPVANFDQRRSSLLQSLPIETAEVVLPERPIEPVAKPIDNFETRRQALLGGGIESIKKDSPFLSGGVLSKAIDILSIGNYASAGLARKVFGLEKSKSAGRSVIEGIKQRASYIDVVKEKTPYEASTNWKKNLVPELWRAGLGLSGDIVLDPLLVLGKLGIIGKGTKVVGVVAKAKIGELAAKSPFVEKAVSIIGKAVISRFKQPELFKELDRARLIEESLIEDRYAQIVRPVADQARAVQKRIAQIVKGGITTRENLRAMAEPIRQEFDRIGEAITKINPKLLSEETFQANKGTYFPRLYTKYEFPTPEQKIQAFFGKRPVRIPGQRFIRREDIPLEVRKKMGEVAEAALPAFKGLTQLGVAETRSKFFKTVAEKFAFGSPTENLLQLPESKLLGDLSGKFVEPSIHDVIQQMVRVPSKLEQQYNNALQIWKSFKTAYNPATVSRNDVTNLLVLNPLGGVPPWRLDLYAEAAKELMTGGKYLQEAKQLGLNITSQAAAELKRKALIMYGRDKGLLSQFFGTAKKFHERVVDVYANQDKFFKLANYIKGVREDGLSPLQAMNRANLYLIDYSEVPGFISWLRKMPFGIPFISFTYGVSKPLAKTLLERPDKLAAYFKTLRAIQSMNPYAETKEELEREQEILPEHIKRERFLKLPFKDVYERSQYLDTQYILPFNPVESGSLRPGNPFFTILSALTTNKDSYFKKEIWKETDTKVERLQKQTKYVLRQLLPNNPLIPGSTSFDKLINAIQKRPDYQGRERDLLKVMVDIIGGLKVTPIDLMIEKGFRESERKKTLIDLRTQLRNVLRSKILDSDEKKEMQEDLLEKIQISSMGGVAN